MRNLMRLAFGLALVAALVASVMPAEAACQAARVITSATSAANASYLFSPGNPFTPNADTGCGNPLGGNQNVCGGSVSYNVNGIFWAWGAGNPTVGLGADSGANKGQYQSNWLQTSYYPYFASLGGTYSNWAFPGTDGCISETGSSSGIGGLPDLNECQVVVLNDFNGPNASFLALSSPPNGAFDFEFTPATGFPPQLNLVPVPKPVINSASCAGGIATIGVSLPVGSLTRANGFDFHCHGAPGEILTGWKLYFRAFPGASEPGSGGSRSIVPQAGFPPTPPWTSTGPASAIGANKSVQVPAGAGRVVLCATLTFGGPSNAAGAADWELKYCSQSSTQVTCDPIMADPGAKNKLRRQSAATPFERDKNPPKQR